MDITIRSAHPEDIPRLCNLLGDLFSLESDFQPDIEKQARGIGLLLEDASGPSHVLVAVHDGVVIGMSSVQTLISTAEGGRVGLVEDVIVDKRFRSRNVGTLLLDGIIAWSMKKGLLRLQLLADRENHQALNFYVSRGWTSTRLNCWRKML